MKCIVPVAETLARLQPPRDHRHCFSRRLDVPAEDAHGLFRIERRDSAPPRMHRTVSKASPDEKVCEGLPAVADAMPWTRSRDNEQPAGATEVHHPPQLPTHVRRNLRHNQNRCGALKPLVALPLPCFVGDVHTCRSTLGRDKVSWISECHEGTDLPRKLGFQIRLQRLRPLLLACDDRSSYLPQQCTRSAREANERLRFSFKRSQVNHRRTRVMEQHRTRVGKLASPCDGKAGKPSGGTGRTESCKSARL